MNSAVNKVALITGAGTGIGKAAAKALLGGGFQVVLTGRNLEKLNLAIQAIGGNQQNSLALACDVGKPEDVKLLFSAIQKQFGRIDVLFNNAGVGAAIGLQYAGGHGDSHFSAGIANINLTASNIKWATI